MRTRLSLPLSIAAAFSAMFVQGAPTTPPLERARQGNMPRIFPMSSSRRSTSGRDPWMSGLSCLDASQPSTPPFGAVVHLLLASRGRSDAVPKDHRRDQESLADLRIDDCSIDRRDPKRSGMSGVYCLGGTPVEQRSTRPQDLQNPRADDELLRLLDSPADYVRRRASLELLANRHETKRAYGTFLVSYDAAASVRRRRDVDGDMVRSIGGAPDPRQRTRGFVGIKGP